MGSLRLMHPRGLKWFFFPPNDPLALNRFRCKSTPFTLSCQISLSGRHPQSPKNIAAQKVSLKLSTYVQLRIGLLVEDY